MSSERREQLIALVKELIAESEVDLDGELDDDTSLIESGTLDSLALLSIAEWVDEQLGGSLDLKTTRIRDEWDSISAVLSFIDRRS